MRSLHPVGVTENFVASGVYTHMENGTAIGSQEHWSIHELPDGAWLIRVDDDWRERNGSSVLIEAWRSPEAAGGRIERFDIHAFGAKDDDIKEVRAKFTFIDDYLEVGRTVNNGERQQFELALPHPYVVAPESLIFGGFEAAMLATNPEIAMSVVSYIPTFLTEATAFRPSVYEQAAQLIGENTVQIGKSQYETRIFAQGIKPGAPTLKLWIDRYDVLIKYENDDGSHSATLTQYARRPD